jgi:hypothetical protein
MHTEFWLKNLKRLLRKNRHKWDIKIKSIGRENVDCIHLAQDRDQQQALANTVMISWVP